MSELEGSGSRNREIVRNERRAARAFRQQDSRIATIEESLNVGIVLDLTTTPQNVRHNLTGLTAIADVAGGSREWNGAYIIKRESPGLGNLITTSTSNDKVFIGLSLDGAPGRVTVVVV